MTGYSSIFSSGLLATPRPSGPVDPYAAPSRPDSPTHMDTDLDVTPTKPNTPLFPYADEASDYFASRSRTSSNASTASSVLGNAPRLRRRRSSLSVATSGLGAVKSPQRSAGAALQRTSLMGPIGRTRSGSIDVGARTDGMSVPGTRARSGSTGGALRPRRALRKPPPVPPPTAPLPPVPTEAVPTRRPLVHRAHTADNYASFGVALGDVGAGGAHLTPGFADKIAAAMSTPPEAAAFWGAGARTNEN
ncbi:hypothetical protein BC834DRAFT_972129 [Gloeopeniophorella convolvens]|nr:hypothetical protein BC834DRAFT_972129 [Gloeopeniophorella convolvens]